MQLAQAVGIDPRDVNFVQYDGGGDLLPAILGDKVDVATSGAGEFKDQIANGDIRVLATSGAERTEGLDAPTFKESGIDLVFTNWRGIVAPPGISDADKKQLVDAFSKMHDTKEWKEALVTNSWADAFLTSDEFSTFLGEQDQRVRDTLSELGLA
jgi:putative tricarboxylic transport membrane protein